MDNPKVRQIGGLIAGVIGAILLSIAADTSTGAGLAITTLLLGILLLCVLAGILQRYYTPGIDQLSTDDVPVNEWKVARFLRLAKEAAPLYLGMRLYLGYEWLHAGWNHVTNSA